MQCNAPAADEVRGSNCLRNMGRLRADACLRGARLEDTWRVAYDILTHTHVFMALENDCHRL
jgi:hypothetical protein